MNNPSQPSLEHALVVKRVFHAPIDRVFEAWTNAERLARWFGPDGFTVVSANIDLRIGGKYHITLRPPEGEHIEHFGEYVEIEPPKKLAFTWTLANQACPGGENQCAETLVTIQFTSQCQSTEVVLTHERLPNKAAYDGHKAGWNSTFDSFENFILTNN